MILSAMASFLGVRDLIRISREVAEEETRFEKDPESMDLAELDALIAKVEKQMQAAAAELHFEMAAELRDRMIELKKNRAELTSEA